MLDLIKTFKGINIKISFVIYLISLSIIIAVNFYIPSPDEWNYLHETILISELISEGKYFGDQFVGTHGFIFKIFPAIIFLFVEPTIYIPFFYHIALNIILCLLLYDIANHLFNSKKYSFFATFFLINSNLFLQFGLINSYLRESAVLFSVVLLFYLIIKKRNFAFILLAIILAIDAKEYIGFGALLTFIIYLIIDNLEKFKYQFSKFILDIGYKLALISLMLITWYYLMYYTPVIPENHSISALLKLDLNSAIYDYKPIVDKNLPNSSRKNDSIKKWASNRDSVYKFFDDIKYENEFRTSITYQDLASEDYEIEVDSTLKLNFNPINTINSKKNTQYSVNIMLDKLEYFIRRIFAKNTFNYNSYPIFLIIIIIFSVLSIMRNKIYPKEWLLFIIFFVLILFIYLKSDYIPRYFYPAILPISLIFTLALKDFLYRKSFVTISFFISFILTSGQIYFNEFSPTFYAALISQLFLVPLIFVGEKSKTIFINLFYFVLIFTFKSFQSVVLYKEMKEEPRGNFEYEMKKIASFFDLENDSIVYLTHRIYPGRSTSQTIKFYNKSRITLNDESSFVHFISSKVPKHKINKYFKQNLFDIHTISKQNEFPNWNVLKNDYLPKNKINRFVFIMDDQDSNNVLHASYYKKDYFNVLDKNTKNNDFEYWRISEYYKDLLFLYRPSWLKLIKKEKLSNLKAIYIYEIRD